MAEQDSVTLRRIWRKWYRPALEDIFKDFESAGFALTPVDAIDEMFEMFKSVVTRGKSAGGSEPIDNALGKVMFRFDDIAMTREAHHYAVGLFYKYYFPRTVESKGKSRRGAPTLPMEHLDEILTLRRKGLNPAQIGKILGQPTDRMRHRVKIAEKVWREAIERVRKLGRTK
jgi:hypothetical protein